MSATGSGKLVVISGPSGAGKTSVCRQLKKDGRVEFSISATTRPKRETEVDGVDYHFMTAEAFAQAIVDDEFLEYASYNGNQYGTLRAPMEQALAEGRIFVLEIEVQGTTQLRDRQVEGCYVFVVPPSIEELRKRLELRGQNSPAEIEARLEIARQELEAQTMYDHIVPNVELDQTIAEVRRIIGL